VRTGSKGDSSFPPGQLVDEPDDPGHSHWLWEDANGDGKFDPAEFHVTGGGAYFTHLPFFDNDLNMWFDDNGNFWDEHGFVIREYKFLGLDSHGSPTWNYATPVDWGLTNYQEIHRVFYYPSTDTMIIVGNTQTIGGTGYIGVGRVIDRYDHWSAIPRPTAPEKLTLPPPSYEIVLPDPKTMPEECMGIAGNYIFVGTLFSAVQQIYDLKTGVYLGSISPGPEVRGQSGWIDMSYGVQPFQRANGEYEVLAEEDAYDKNILYRLRLPDSGYGVGEGLRADYYAGTNFEKLTATRVVPQVKPAADGTGGYSVKWTGQLRAVTSGSYVLHLLADAGARLTLNGVLAVDHWLSTPTRATYTATLSAGQLYPVELDYFHNKGNAHVVFSWTMPGASSATPIPRSQLYPAAVIGNGAGLHGDYYTGTKYDKLSFSRIDPTIDFDWSQKATDSRLGLTGYSVKWSGTIEPEYSERYKFSGKSDDGMRVTINGVPVVDHLVGHGEWTGTMPYDLVAGQRYPIQIEYYQDRGAAFGHLSWESASTPQEIVPTTQLYPAAPAFPIPSP